MSEREKGKLTCLTFSHLLFLSGQSLPYGKLIFHLAPQELLRKPNPTLPCMVLHRSIRVEGYLKKAGSQLIEKGVSQWNLRKQARTVSKHSDQIRSVTQSCPTLCDPMNCSTPGLPVHHQLPESTQTHVHWVGDAIQPSHSLSSPSPLPPIPPQSVFSNESTLRMR